MSQLFKDFRVQTTGYGNLEYIFNKAKGIDLGKIGHRSGFRDTSISKNKMDQLMRITVATAMSQGIGGGQTEGALAVRSFLPQFDFGDENDVPFKTNEWSFHYDRFEPYPHRNMRSIEPPYMKDKVIARTSKLTRNDQKVYMLYGFKYLDTNHSLHAHEFQIWRRGTKLLDRFPLPKFATDRPFKRDIFETPCLFFKDDLMEIRAILKDPERDELFDRIQFLGFVVESLGMMVLG